MKSIWWKSQPILSYNKTLNFVIGNRGGGKTIEAMRTITWAFIKHGFTSIWTRRQEVELDSIFMEKFFTDPAFLNQFPDYEFKTKKTKYGGIGYLRRKGDDFWVAYIQFMPLSTCLKHKSVPFPSVKYIIYDEFIIDKMSNMRYLKNEVFIFLEFLQSVMRLRENVRCLFIGNSISVINPYFLYYNIKKPKKEFTAKGDICIQYYKNPYYTEQLKNSRFGNLVKNTEYANYAIENEFIRDKYDFIEKRPKTAHYWFAIKYDDNYFSVWQDGKSGNYYICNTYDKNRLIFALTNEDHTLNTIMIQNKTKYLPIVCLIENYELGRIRFENLKIASMFDEILYLIG